MKYYNINEADARRAHEMNSHSDYAPLSATNRYRDQVNLAYEIAERQKQRVDALYYNKIDALCDLYARKLADWHNKSFTIEQRCPSIFVAGGSNFPAAKKIKQNTARDNHMVEYNCIQGILDKIRSAGMGGVGSDDPFALDKLKAKLADLEAKQQQMKAANDHYRKHRTMKGFIELTAERAAVLDALIKERYSWEQQPYPSYLLNNNNAAIRRTRQRISELEQKRDNSAIQPPGETVMQHGQVL